MAKFKKDDKVRLRNNLKVEGVYGGLRFLDCMLKDMAGKIKVIVTTDTFGEEHYSLKGSAFSYSAEMLELAEDTHVADCKCGACATGEKREPKDMEVKEKEYIVIYEHEENRKYDGDDTLYDYMHQHGMSNLKTSVGRLVSEGCQVFKVFEVTKKLIKKITVDIEELK